MPSFSRNLEETLQRSIAYANQRKHEYATLEHLLLSLADDPDAATVMKACNVDLAAIKKNLVNYLDTELKSLVVEDGGEDAKPTAGFQRVIQRAVIHVQSSGRDEVSGANVLVAVFSERESHAAFFLQEQEMTRYDAVNFIAHGIAKKAGASEPRAVKGQTDDEEKGEKASKPGEALEGGAGMKPPKLSLFEPNFGEAFARAVELRLLGGGRKEVVQSFGTDPLAVVQH